MENQTYSWRWRLAQFLELRWWRRYLQQLNWPDYVEAKRVHWRKVLTQMDLHLLPDERVLDAGCGPAGIFTILKDQKVDAIDPLLLAYEEKLPDFRRDQFPYVHFQPLMLEQLDQQEVYDHVFCLNAINHVADLERAARCLIQSLKTAGTLLISIDVHRFALLKFIFRMIPGDVLHPQQDGLGDYVHLLKKLGLDIEKTLVLKRGWIFNYVVIKAKKRMAPQPEQVASHSGNSVKR
ncbi:class I SAM-dependent methyltransferase [Haliscomenobacter sp.]|uniref:class I SAM-dependent methyltransferase n=1 Tax=Haliscomenobacter sp. TaxID=2717303 RepID=UPI003BAC9029